MENSNKICTISGSKKYESNITEYNNGLYYTKYITSKVVTTNKYENGTIN